MEKFLWEHEIDFQQESQVKIAQLQEEHLLNHINFCLQKSPFYSKHRPRSISKVTTLSEISQLSFTSKDDLLQYNNEFLAVPKMDIVDTCFTSATVGTAPVNFWLTKSDLDRLAYNEQVAFQISGVTKEDTMAVCVAIERGFMAGIAYFLGGVKIGTHMIRVGASGPQHIWNLLKVHQPTVMIGVPSVLANVGKFAVSEGENPASLKIKRILGIGESTRDKNLKLLPSVQLIEEMWQAPLYSTYASTEMSTSFPECLHRQGGHLRPELIYVEIVNDEGELVKDGEIGEVVVTPLGVQGMPLMRFKTGDMSYLINEPCACGRTTKRIGPVIGRKSQMLKYKGTNVFPNAVVSIVEANNDFLGCYVEAYTAEYGEDRVVAAIAATSENYDLVKLKEEFRAGLRVVPELKIVDKDEFLTKTQPEGKRKRQIFFDMREGR